MGRARGSCRLQESQDFFFYHEALAVDMVTTATAPSLPSDLYLEPADVHVLLVDDERLSRLVVSALLCRCGYRVSTAKSGREALTLLAEKPNEHHLLLTDVMMPDVDGLQLLRYVRSSKQLKAMPVIMMSANEHSLYTLNRIA